MCEPNHCCVVFYACGIQIVGDALKITRRCVYALGLLITNSVCVFDVVGNETSSALVMKYTKILYNRVCAHEYYVLQQNTWENASCMARCTA